MKKSIILVVLVAIFLGACATIYRSPEFYEVRQKHRIVALLPFDVTISSTRLPKGMTIEMLREMEKEEGFGTQSLFYSRFLKKSADFSVTFQDVDMTIHDGTTGELFWKYSHQLSGSICSSSEQLVKAFTRKIARNFPYLLER